MTLSEWLFGNALQILIILIGGIYGLAKIRKEQLITESRIEEIANKVSDHMSSEFPHQICRLEAQKIDSVLESIKDLSRRFEILDNRIVELLSDYRGHK